MQFRITSCLFLGLIIALIGGCSCGEHCRLPLLHRICGGKMCVQQDAMFASSSSCRGCITDPGVDPTWYSDKGPALESVLDSSQKSDAEDSPPNPDEPKSERPDVPKPPSKELKNNDVKQLPELKRAVPPTDDNSYNAPARPPIELDPSQSITITPESLAGPQPLPVEIAPGDLSSNRRSVVNPAETVVPVETAPVEIEPANKRSVTQVDAHSVPQHIDVVNHPTKKIKATTISTSKNVSEPPVLKAASPKSNGVTNEESLELQYKNLPAKSFDTEVTGPIVLRAVPSESHIVIDRRIAERRGDGSLGLSMSEMMEINDLPALEEDAMSDRQVDFSTSGEKFEEPPVDSRIPEVELLPQNSTLHPIEPGQDGFTKPTSYQVPVENTASLLLNAMLEDDGGKPDQVPDQIVKKNETQSGASSRPNQHGSIFKILDPTPPAAEVRILRLRATTPIDRTQRVAPIVSIKSIMEPVIVRNVHPDASLPAVELQAAKPGNPAPSVIDEDRLGDSIRGLSSRPKVPQTWSKTIDR